MKKGTKLFEVELQKRMKELSNFEFGTKDFDDALTSIQKLYDLKEREDKASSNKGWDVFDKFSDYTLRTAAIAAPLIFNGIWLKRGLEFETTGAFTSQTFRSLWGRFVK